MGAVIDMSSLQADIATITRGRKIIATKAGNEEDFSVVTYNILADCWVLPEWYDYTPEDCRTSLQIHDRLMAELRVLNGDIVCLQEVGVEYQPFLAKELEKQGYKGEYCQHVGQGDGQGDATYYKTEKFECLQTKRFTFNQMLEEAVEKVGVNKEILDNCVKDETFLILQLKHIESGTLLTVGNIHAVWEQFSQLDVSSLHAALSLGKLSDCAGNNPFIIAGDFNSAPDMAPYSLLDTGALTRSHGTKLVTEASTRLGDKSLFELLDSFYQHDVRDLTSSYLAVRGEEPSFTINNNYDGDYLLNTCLDYIWFTASMLEVVSVLDTTRPEQLLPDKVFPSDHLSLKASYKFKH